MTPLSSSVNQMVTSHSPCVLQSPAICAVRRHNLQTTFSLSVLKVLLFFWPVPSLRLRKGKAILFEQIKNANIQSGYTMSVFSVGVKKMWNWKRVPLRLAKQTCQTDTMIFRVSHQRAASVV